MGFFKNIGDPCDQLVHEEVIKLHDWIVDQYSDAIQRWCDDEFMPRIEAKIQEKMYDVYSAADIKIKELQERIRLLEDEVAELKK